MYIIYIYKILVNLPPKCYILIVGYRESSIGRNCNECGFAKYKGWVETKVWTFVIIICIHLAQEPIISIFHMEAAPQSWLVF